MAYEIAGRHEGPAESGYPVIHSNASTENEQVTRETGTDIPFRYRWNSGHAKDYRLDKRVVKALRSDRFNNS